MDITFEVFSIILLILVSTSSQVNRSSLNKSPEITVKLNGSEIQNNVDLNERITLTRQNFPVKFRCMSLKPIQWTFYGHGKVSKLKIEKEIMRNAVDDIEVYFVATLSLSKLDISTVGKYTCKTIKYEANQSSSFNLFIKDAGKDASYINAGQTLAVYPIEYQNPIIIPCSATAPGEHFYLEETFPMWPSRTVDVPYDPTKGFLIDIKEMPSFEGKYQCNLKGNYEAGNTVNFIVNPSKDFYVKPALEDYKTKTGVKVSCSSIYEVDIKFDDNELRDVTVIHKIKPSLTFKYSVTLEYNPSPGEIGSISCLRRNGVAIHTWSYSHQDFDWGLTMSPNKKGIQCRAVSEGKLFLNAQYCQYSDECTIEQKGFTTDENVRDGDEPIEILSCGPGCLELKISKSGGLLVNCSSDGNSVTRSFFVGMDKKIYEQSEDVPDEAVMTIQNSSTYGFTGGIKYSTCTWSPYYFSKTVNLSLTFSNGTSINGELRNGVENPDGSFTLNINPDVIHSSTIFINCSYWNWKSGELKHLSQTTGSFPDSNQRYDDANEVWKCGSIGNVGVNTELFLIAIKAFFTTIYDNNSYAEILENLESNIPEVLSCLTKLAVLTYVILLELCQFENYLFEKAKKLFNSNVSDYQESESPTTKKLLTEIQNGKNIKYSKSEQPEKNNVFSDSEEDN